MKRGVADPTRPSGRKQRAGFFRRLGEAWRHLLGRSRRDAFDAGAVNRLVSDWITSIRSADAEIKGKFRLIRSRARDLARNNGYLRHYLNLLIANVIGDHGMKLQAMVRSSAGALVPETNRKIEAAWKDWADGKVTVDGKLGLLELQDLLLATVATDGEVFVRIFTGFPGNPHGIALQPIDADLIDETLNLPAEAKRREVRMGVEVDELGAPVGYWVWSRSEDDRSLMPRIRYFVPAAEMLHLYKPLRVNQTRGVTWFASVLYPVQVLDGYEEAELFAARSGASNMGFFKTQAGVTAEVELDTKTPIQIEASPASLEKLPAGWEFQSWSPDHPIAAFGLFVKQVLRKIAGGLGVAYNSIGNDLEGVNYSSLKNGLGGERDQWRIHQRWWINSFLRPIYGAWLPMAMLTGTLRLESRDPRRYLAARFGARGWPWIEPLKEMQAAILGIKNGLGSRTAFLAEQGVEFEDVLQALAEEKALAESLGVSIEETNPAATIQDGPDPAADAGPRGLVA